MRKKILLSAAVLLSLWNLVYIAVLIDSVIEEYFMDRFFYWGYPQWGFLYSSPQIYLCLNLLYIPILLAGTGLVWLWRYKPERALVPAVIIALLSVANMYAPDYNRYYQFKLYQNEKGKDESRIPEGEWLLQVGNMEHYDNQSVLMKLKGVWGRGDWPGGYAFWGEARAWMQPDSVSDVGNRRGFVLHGGTKNGSPWGINIGSDMADFANKIDGYLNPMALTVNYDGSSGKVSE